MEPATTVIHDGVPIIYLHGRIDATVTDRLEEIVTEFLSDTKGDSVVIDCSDLDYISSAGLRQILTIKKKKNDTFVINCSDEIYSTFETTGFTQMMNILKSFRSMSVDGCEVVGSGAKGTVYRIDPETVLKLFADPNALPSIYREQSLAKEAFVLGIPTAIPYDVVKVGQQFGSVFELLDCADMSSHLNDEDGINIYARIYADLLHTIHSIEASEKLLSSSLPSAKQRALDHISCLNSVLPAETFSRLKKLIEEIPESKKLVHGDLHAKNIMMQNGEAIIIDMDTLSYGDPIFELAYMFNAYIGRNLLHPEELEKFMDLDAEKGREFWNKTLSLYCGTEDPAVLQHVEDCAALIGYSRLLSRFYRKNLLDEGDNKELARIYTEKIIELADRLDQLNYASAVGQKATEPA